MTDNALLNADGHEISVGVSIGTFARETGFATWNRYAAVNDEFVPIHMDDAAGQAAGYDGAFGMGNLQWAYMHNLVRGWMGEGGRLTRFSCQFRKPNLKGQVTAFGKVTGVTESSSGTEVELEVWTEDESGDRMAPATATVLFAAS
ncbi:MaoC/PaaZ C-terminal domain-containing protein [Mycetocola zhadangensis]|uniref:MaoC/PaaZ C-terminal domain-containing protein n=1 Tax=Mycetocola zhadangensis TaxID=1164595 RepID=UPI003A4D3DBB